METTEEEINQTIVINDLLSFVWCKLELFSEEKVLKCIQEYYGKEEASDALRTLLTALPEEYEKGFQRSGEENPFVIILDILKNCSTVAPVFVCKDLNNVPKLEATIKSEHGNSILESRKDFDKEHQLIKSQLNEALNFLCELKKQFQYLTENNNNKNTSDKNSSHINKVKKHNANVNSAIKGLSYLQNLIDEAAEEESKEFGYSEFDEIEDEDLLDQRSKLLANRHQRASLNHRSKDRTVRFNDTGRSPTRKVIQFEKNEQISIVNSFDGENDIYDDEYVNEMELHVGSPLHSSQDDGQRYLVVEDQFEENIGFFTVMKCSVCSFCSNDEETAMEHKCINKVSFVKKPTVKSSSILQQPVIKKMKKQDISKRNVFECHRCDSVFKSRKELMIHIEGYLEGGYRCPMCETRFPQKEWLNHVHSCPGNGTTTREDHYCEVCDVFFADKRTLCNHRAFHDPCRPFECSECKFRFYTPKNVEDHMQKHTSLRFNKKCPFCNFRSTEQIKIVDHTRCHTGDRPYKCPKCDHYCSTYEGVQRHLTSHTLSKNFACDICGKRFNSQNNMASHRKIHKVDKPHKCPICKKTFKFGRLMKLHHNTHLDIREHKCPHCPYKARTAVVLRGHMNTHTNTKPFKCSLCDFGANHKSYLSWHMKYYHPS